MLMTWCYLRMVDGPYSHLRGTQGNLTGWNTDHLFLLLAGAFTGMESPYSHLRGTQGNLTGWNTDHLFLLLAGAFTGMEGP
jgi:hypothetical protein